ncbi:MAG: signal peptidase I [Pseudomonadota bacterium]
MAKIKTQPKDGGGLWETLKTIFWALLIAGAFRTILFQPFSIPSGSMKPELLIGDYLFVSKFAYGYSRYSLPFEPDLFEGRWLGSLPERGDVIVFKHPKHDQCSGGPIERITGFAGAVFGQVQPNGGDCRDYIKRVVGLPGDKVQVISGVLHLNGEAVPTERIENFIEPRVARGAPPRYPRCINGPLAEGADCLKEQYLETLPGGANHRVLNIAGTLGERGANRRAGADNTPVFEVPEGELFFMGDNRDNSVDSRFINQVGFVPLENVIGRADLIAISSDGAFWEVWKWRLDRLFKTIE